MASIVPVVSRHAYFEGCVNVLIQHRLRSALAGVVSGDIAASLLRVFLEASLRCWTCSGCEEAALMRSLVMIAAGEVTERVSSVRAVDVHTRPSHH